MLPIVVATTEPACVASLALTMEGLEVVEHIMRDHFNYGRLLTQQWQSKQGFILVEHDIVPWPGALKQLDECQCLWGAFQYPNGVFDWGTGTGLCNGLGCMKFSTELVQKYEAPQLWSNTGWDALDGAVHRLLMDGYESCHIHTPLVAHVKTDSLVLKRG